MLFTARDLGRMLQLDERCDINAVFLEIGVLRCSCSEFCENVVCYSSTISTGVAIELDTFLQSNIL